MHEKRKPEIYDLSFSMYQVENVNFLKYSPLNFLSRNHTFYYFKLVHCAHKLDISKPMYVMNFHELAAYYFQISMPYPAMDRTDRQKTVTHFSCKD